MKFAVAFCFCLVVYTTMDRNLIVGASPTGSCPPPQPWCYLEAMEAGTCVVEGYSYVNTCKAYDVNCNCSHLDTNTSCLEDTILHMSATYDRCVREGKSSLSSSSSSSSSLSSLSSSSSSSSSDSSDSSAGDTINIKLLS